MVPDFSEREAVEHIEQLEGLLYALTNKPNLENFIEAVEYARKKEFNLDYDHYDKMIEHYKGELKESK